MMCCNSDAIINKLHELRFTNYLRLHKLHKLHKFKQGFKYHGNHFHQINRLLLLIQNNSKCSAFTNLAM